MRFLLSFLLLSGALTCSAQLRLPSFLSDNMVLQQQKPNRIWGWAAPDAMVELEFKGKHYAGFAGRDGAWSMFLEPAVAGRAGNLVVKSGLETRELHNVLVGEVWICSGQSNMEFTLSTLGDTYKSEMANAADDELRFVTVQKTYSNRPLQDAVLEHPWSAIDSASVRGCSAVAYWYGKTLRRYLHVPVGLIVTSWGGTPAQAWTSFEGLHDLDNYTQIFSEKIHALDMDHLAEKVAMLQEEYKKQVRGKFPYIHDALKPGFDDRKWIDMYLPKEWEEQGYPNLDGVGVFRLNFQIDKADAGKAAILHMPAVDDADSTYINGIFIGSMDQWDALRTYNVPAGILKAGKNLLTIVVDDGQGGGGLSPREDLFNIQIGEKKIPLAGKAKFEIIAEKTGIGGNNGSLEHQPSMLFNAMIAPLLPASIRGAIWYQGESNAGLPYEYRSLFPAMIRDWRYRWGQGDFPFLFVQLSSFGSVQQEPGPSDWALLREAQTQTLDLPNTGMAVTIDVGNPFDIHPVRKREVGERLADEAMRLAYGHTDKISAGPRYKSFTIKENQLIVSFNNTGGGLLSKDGPLRGFAIAGADGKYVWADAAINGDKVILSSKAVAAPVSARYAWADSPIAANLYNQEGYPALPFRTDAAPAGNPVVAHRGAWKRKGLPENSIASLRTAIELGCSGSEFDVRMTADDSLVINHDPHYNGMPIEKTAYADLLRYKLSNGEKLPTLREYLAAGLKDNRTTRLICEIKPSDLSKERGLMIAERALRLVQSLNAETRTVFISFDYDMLKKIATLCSDCETQYLEGDRTPEQLKNDGIKGLDYHFSVYREHPEWVSDAKRLGLILNAWTVNETPEIQRLLEAGFGAVTTNEPELVMSLFCDRIKYK